jgi:hypothetical protein
MAIALVANVASNAGTNAAVTTAGIDTTGANLIVVAVGYNTVGTLTDSKSNTWTALTTRGSAPGSKLYYCVPSSVGAAHTFTWTASFPSICVAAFSGAHATPFDLENGNNAGVSVTSIQPGSITPSEDNELVIAGFGYNGTQTVSINGGFTISDQKPLNSGVAYGSAMAYLIQTTAAAANPAWSWTGAQNAAASIASFKAGAAAATKRRYTLTTLGVG